MSYTLRTILYNLYVVLRKALGIWKGPDAGARDPLGNNVKRASPIQIERPRTPHKTPLINIGKEAHKVRVIYSVALV